RSASSRNVSACRSCRFGSAGSTPFSAARSASLARPRASARSRLSRVPRLMLPFPLRPRMRYRTNQVRRPFDDTRNPKPGNPMSKYSMKPSAGAGRVGAFRTVSFTCGIRQFHYFGPYLDQGTRNSLHWRAIRRKAKIGLMHRRKCGVIGSSLFHGSTAGCADEATIYHFNRFPLYSLVAKAIADGVTSWPGAVVNLPSMPAAGLVLVALGGLWLSIWTRRWRWLGLAPIAAGYLTLLLVRPPDLLIAGEGGLIAARSADGGYLLSRLRGQRIVQEAWLRRGAASGAAEAFPRIGNSADGRLSCTAAACVYQARGRSVALVREADALADECAHADLVVSPVPAWRLCQGPLIIDSIDRRRYGAHAVWLDPDAIRIESVADWRGVRRWVPGAAR